MIWEQQENSQKLVEDTGDVQRVTGVAESRKLRLIPTTSSMKEGVDSSCCLLSLPTTH